MRGAGFSSKCGDKHSMAFGDDYRRYAAECLALAQKTSNADDKARLLQMAQVWRDLVDKHEAKDEKE
jgi:hypothetical protein